MTRIIAGRAKGRRIAIPKSGTRPTSDRVREALFASIESKLRDDRRAWSDVAVCDLWAGSGGVALEAWSRGSRRVLAVDRAKSAVDAIVGNIAALGAGEVRVERADVVAALRRPPAGGPFDLLFADPPYDLDDEAVRRCIDGALASGWCNPDAIIVVERRAGGRTPFPPAIDRVDERTYGDSALWYGRVVDEREEPPL